VLRAAGAGEADMLVAATLNDETNILACKLAAMLFRVPVKIARVRSRDYTAHPEIFAADGLSVDHVISPEQEVTLYLKRLIEYPNALQVVEFARGRVRLVAVRVSADSYLVGHQLKDIRKRLPTLDARVVAIYRRDRMIQPDGHRVLEIGDEVFFVAATENIRAVVQEMREAGRTARRLMIAGGGNIGRRLAEALEGSCQIKLIERQKAATQRLAAELRRTLVLAGDATDEDLLLQENVEEMDVFCALTNDDEVNIMSCLLAKRLGARRVIALINRSSYVDLLQSGQIDIAVSPALVTIGPLLSHVRRGDMAVVHSLRRGAAEAMEAVVHGDSETSPLVGRRIEQLELPEGVGIAAILRGESVLIAHHDTMIEAEDHVILYVPSKRTIPKVERLFQAGKTPR
jgi:trk system potassium uptake protein TrkA